MSVYLLLKESQVLFAWNAAYRTWSLIVTWIPAIEVDKGPVTAHADQESGQDINNAENEGAQECGPESCNVKPLDDAPDEIEDQAIDYEISFDFFDNERWFF